MINKIKNIKNLNKWLWQYIRFLIVGTIGTIINLAILIFLTEEFEIYYVYSEIVAIAAAATFNFLGSKYWVFKVKK